MKEINPRFYYAAAGLVCGLTGGVLSAIMKPWLAWGIAGMAMSLLPLSGRRRTLWTFILQLVVLGVGAAIIGQLAYTLLSATN
jgi:hypothetical protein